MSTTTIQLSHYLDRTEVLLVQQVTFRSTKVFDAFVQYNELEDELKEAIPMISTLRKDIQQLNSILAKKPLQVSGLTRKKNNMKRTLNILKVVYAVQQSQTMVDELIESGDFITAMELIYSTKDVATNDLASLKCFRNLPEQLDQKIIEVQSKTQNLFISKLVETYLHLGDAELPSIESQIGPITTPILTFCDTTYLVQKYKDKIVPFVNERLATSIEKLLEGFKITTRSPITGVDQNASKYLSTTTIQHIKSIQMDQFITLLSGAFTKGLSIISNGRDILTALFKLFENLKSKEKVKASYILREFEKINTTLTELVHSRLSLIVSLRGDIVKSSTKTELLQFMDMSFNFIEKSEMILGKKINHLRGSLQAIGQTFLDEFNKQHLEKMRTILEKENWLWIENIQAKYQEIVDNITDIVNKHENMVTKERSADNEPTKYFEIRGELFPVCASFLHLVKMTRNYLDMLAPDHQKFVNSFDLSARINNLLSVSFLPSTLTFSM